jgi:hypothetical protein
VTQRPQLPAQPPVTPPQTDFTGTNGNDILFDNGEANTLKGLRGNDKLFGSGKSDNLYGGFGNDTLSGEVGADKFVFDTKPNAKSNKDAIKDFRVVDDTIWLDNAAFTKVGKNGALKSSAFFVNKTGVAHDASDRVIYDKDSGVLYYDADGTGGAAGVAFATISKNLALTYNDFLVVWSCTMRVGKSFATGGCEVDDIEVARALSGPEAMRLFQRESEAARSFKSAGQPAPSRMNKATHPA